MGLAVVVEGEVGFGEVLEDAGLDVGVAVVAALGESLVIVVESPVIVVEMMGDEAEGIECGGVPAGAGPVPAVQYEG
jgi:hypothetical protein